MLSRVRTATFGALVVGIIVMSATAASAQSPASGNLNVQANVTKNCVVSSSSINFGNYDPTSTTALDGEGAVTLRCTKGTSTRIDLGSVGARQMASATTGDTLAYQLYSDSSRGTVWGSGAGSGVTWSSTTSANTSVAVYGRVGAGQNVGAASDYVQTVSVTVVY